MRVTKTSVWLQAFRLHTLPLALACIGMGNAMAAATGRFDGIIALLSVLTAICLQILSNLANDYGDTRHGADNPERKGPKRMVQQGMISGREIKNGILVFMFLSLLCGSLMLLSSLRNIGYPGAMGLFLLGILSIAAAIAYTATKKPYGYHGLGDLSVFLFFGWLAVGGSFYLQTGEMPFAILAPATGMGLLCAGVLNVNNIRDIEADERASKKTIAVKLGLKNAKIYHWFLLIGSLPLFALYYYYTGAKPTQYLFLLPWLIFIWNGYGIWKSHEPADINPYLKYLVLSILIFAVVYCAGLFV